MNLLEKIKQWRQTRRDNLAKRFADEYVDILTLHSNGILRAKATGQSITDIRAEIQSLVRVPIKVTIPHGTYFKASGSHQNMVSRCEYRFDLDPMETEYIDVPASCINASLPIPGGEDDFYGVGRVSKNLARFLQAAEDESAMTVQAGVWAITDGYTGSQVQQHLRRVRRVDPFERLGGLGRSSGLFHELGDRGGLTVDEGSAVSDHNIRRAREILAEIKIRTNL